MEVEKASNSHVSAASAGTASGGDGSITVTSASLAASLTGATPRPGVSAAVAAGIAAGNIKISAESAETYELSSTSQAEKTRQSSLLADFALRRKARQVHAPTNDNLVRRRLRELGHPITLFGERAPGRRERLQGILARLAMEEQAGEGGDEKMKDEEGEEERTVKKVEKKAYLTAGTDQLRSARLSMAKYSLDRVRERLNQEREELEIRHQHHRTKHHTHVLSSLHSYVNHASTIGDVRPLSSCAINRTATQVATASWSGLCKIWSLPSCSHVLTLNTHKFNATDIAFHPLSGGNNHSVSSVNLASCGMDASVLLWSLKPDEEILPPIQNSSYSSDSTSLQPSEPTAFPLATLIGHTERCCRLAFHPSGLFLVTASYDRTWRLWDITTQAEVLAQPDSGGIGHLWDVRTGRSILSLVGHAKNLLALDFHPNGHTLATGSLDNTVKLWDIRMKHTLYTLPAHSKLISSLKWGRRGKITAAKKIIKKEESGDIHMSPEEEKESTSDKIKEIPMKEEKEEEKNPLETSTSTDRELEEDYSIEKNSISSTSDYLLTSSYDGTVKVWDGFTLAPVKTLVGHSAMVMKVDCSNSSYQQETEGEVMDGNDWIVSASYDRSWKLWSIDFDTSIATE